VSYPFRLKEVVVAIVNIARRTLCASAYIQFEYSCRTAAAIKSSIAWPYVRRRTDCLGANEHNGGTDGGQAILGVERLPQYCERSPNPGNNCPAIPTRNLPISETHAFL
jgi:hypothetical protein